MTPKEAGELALQQKTHKDLVDIMGWARDLIVNDKADQIAKEIILQVQSPLSDPLYVLAAMRGSYSARRKIPRWNGLVGIVKTYLDERGRNGESLVKGLHDPNYD